MCYSGRCPYENYLGDCNIGSKTREKWKKRSLSPCRTEWDIIGEIGAYFNIIKEIEKELKA